MAACLVEAGDLAAGEAPLGAVVGDAHVAVGEQVVVRAPALVGEATGPEGRAGLSRGGALAVGEDVEAREGELGEQPRGPAAPVEADRGAGVGADELADLGRDGTQLADE